MKNKSFDINKMRVASPCHIGWETMTGNERVRRCDSCELNIYNIEEMTKPEIKTLIETHEGRLCIRLHKRADGTVLTKDCPIGFRAYQKRVARFASAVLATFFGLFSIGFGQEDKSYKDANPEIVENKKSNQETILSGTVIDSNGAIIPNVTIQLLSKNNKKLIRTRTSNDKGQFSFKYIEPDTYTIVTKAFGFSDSKSEVEIVKGKTMALVIKMEPKAETVTVGIFSAEPLIDFTKTDVTTTVYRRDN